MIYYFVVILFAVLMGVMIFLSAINVYLSFPAGANIDWLKLIQQPYFQNTIISLFSTYALYFFASILHGDPFHMAWFILIQITSFVQYMLMLPSFVNVLMVYAFCNLHDVRYGFQ